MNDLHPLKSLKILLPCISSDKPDKKWSILMPTRSYSVLTLSSLQSAMFLGLAGTYD